MPELPQHLHDDGEPLPGHGPGGDAHMLVCAEACRRCAESCRQMAAMA